MHINKIWFKNKQTNKQKTIQLRYDMYIRAALKSAKRSLTFRPGSLYLMTKATKSSDPDQNVRECLALLNKDQSIIRKQRLFMYWLTDWSIDLFIYNNSL